MKTTRKKTTKRNNNANNDSSDKDDDPEARKGLMKRKGEDGKKAYMPQNTSVISRIPTRKNVPESIDSKTTSTKSKKEESSCFFQSPSLGTHALVGCLGGWV